MTTETPYRLPNESRREIFHGLLRKVMFQEKGTTHITFNVEKFTDEDWVVINALADEGFGLRAIMLCLKRIAEEVEAKALEDQTCL